MTEYEMMYRIGLVMAVGGIFFAGVLFFVFHVPELIRKIRKTDTLFKVIQSVTLVHTEERLGEEWNEKRDWGNGSTVQSAHHCSPLGGTEVLSMGTDRGINTQIGGTAKGKAVT